MSIEALAALGEFVGGIGVLATLFYPAMEVRQNSRLLRANAKTSGMLSFADFNVEDRFRLTLALRAIIQRVEAQYFRYSEGMVDETYWIQRKTWLRSLISAPNIAEWWLDESRSASLTEEFVDHINSVEFSFKLGPQGQIDRGKGA